MTDVALLLPSFAINSPNEPFPVPVNVNVRVPVPLIAILLVPAKVKVAEPDASIVPPLALIVNKRSVLLLALPVYFNVPPFNTNLVAEVEFGLPISLFVLLAANFDTLKVPALIVVTPL